MAQLAPTAYAPRADAAFEYVIAHTGTATGRAETREGLAIVSPMARLQMIEGKITNVRARMRQHYPNATEVAVDARAAKLRLLAKRTPKEVDEPPPVIRFRPALPVGGGFHAKKEELTERERMERYGDPWDQIHPMFKPLLTRDVDSRFAITHQHAGSRK